MRASSFNIALEPAAQRLSYKDGLINQEDVEKSGDDAYRVGQRLVVKPSAVLRLADIVDKLPMELRPA